MSLYRRSFSSFTIFLTSQSTPQEMFWCPSRRPEQSLSVPVEARTNVHTPQSTQSWVTEFCQKFSDVPRGIPSNLPTSQSATQGIFGRPSQRPKKSFRWPNDVDREFYAVWAGGKSRWHDWRPREIFCWLSRRSGRPKKSSDVSVGAEETLRNSSNFFRRLSRASLSCDVSAGAPKKLPTSQLGQEKMDLRLFWTSILTLKGQ